MPGLYLCLSGGQPYNTSNLFLYATSKWALLQSLACWLLYTEGFIEPPLSMDKAYDILLHQALSITKGHSGIQITELVKKLKDNFAFKKLETIEIEAIINHLIEIDFLEKLQTEVIIGIEGEKIVNSRDFYTVFIAEENFKVVNAGRTIGEVPYSPQIREDENIFLAAKIWKIKFVDEKTKKIEVIPAKDGNKPVFYGGGAVIHQRIRKKMLEILFSGTQYDILNPSSAEKLTEMRKEFSVFNIKEFQLERPLYTDELKVIFYSFSGTRTNRTISYLMTLAGIKNDFDDYSSSFEIDISGTEFKSMWDNLWKPMDNINHHIANLLETNPAILGFSKWGVFLPLEFKIKLIKQKYFELETLGIVQTYRLVENRDVIQ